MARFKIKLVYKTLIKLAIILFFSYNPIPLANGQLSIRRKTSADQCERLPPPTNASLQMNQVLNADNEDNSLHPTEVIEQLLEDGMQQLPFQSHDKSAILILGNTGSGKTTLSLTINGDHNRIRAVKTYKGNLVIVDDDDKIGAPTTTSKTLVPEYIVNPNNSQAFYDCPGFDDNRGPEMDIAAMYFVKAITEHITRAKFLFTVTHSSIRIGNDRNDFDLLAKHATRFLRRIDKMPKSVGLIITKVNSFDPLTGDYLSDDHIMDEAGEFLLSYHKRLTNNLNSLTEAGGTNPDIPEIRRKLLFVEALLEQDDEGTFTKIWFLRNPPKCGPYINIPYAAEVRQKIIDMYTQNLEFAEVVKSDFGFTLKDTTMLKIKDTFIPDVKTSIIQSTNDTLSHLMSDYVQDFRGKFSATGGEKVAAVLKLEQHYENLRERRNSIMDYRKGAAVKVSEISQALGNRDVDERFLNQTEMREKCLSFFRGLENGVDGVVAETDSKTFSGLREIFLVFLRDISLFHSDVTLDLLKGAVPETRAMIDDTAENVMLAMYEDYMSWFNETLSRDTVLALTSFTREYKNLERFYQRLNESSGNTVVSRGLEYLGRNVFPEVSDPSIAQGIANIKILEGQLNKLVNLTGANSFQPTFSPAGIVMSFRSMRVHVLNMVQDSMIPEQQQRIQEAALLFADAFVEKYGELLMQHMNTEDGAAFRVALQNLEDDYRLIESRVKNVTGTGATVGGEIDTLLSEIKITALEYPTLQQQAPFQLLNDIEANLTALRRAVEITESGESRVIETVILHISREFTTFRSKIHHIIRDELIPNLVNAMEGSTQEKLTTLLGDYFAAVGGNLKQGGRNGAAALTLLRKDCSQIKQFEEAQLRKNSDFSARAQVNQIFTSLGRDPQDSSYFPEMEKNEESIEFLQGIVRRKKKAKTAAQVLTGLNAIVLNFLRQFQQSCAAARKGESTAVPNGVKKIDAQVKRALRKINDAYISQFNIQQETDTLLAFKKFLEDFKKLQKFNRDIDDNPGDPKEILTDLQGILWHGADKNGAPSITTEFKEIEKVQNELQPYLQVEDSVGSVNVTVSFGPHFAKEVFQPFQALKSNIMNEVQNNILPDILGRIQSAGMASVRTFMQTFEADFYEKITAAGSDTDAVILAMKTDINALLNAMSFSNTDGSGSETELAGTMSVADELDTVYSSSNLITQLSPDHHNVLKSLESQFESTKKLFKIPSADSRKQHVGRYIFTEFQRQLTAFRDQIVAGENLKRESEAAERREREWKEQRKREREESEARERKQAAEWKSTMEELARVRKEQQQREEAREKERRKEREEERERERKRQLEFQTQLTNLMNARPPPPPSPPKPKWYEYIPAVGGLVGGLSSLFG